MKRTLHLCRDHASVAGRLAGPLALVGLAATDWLVELRGEFLTLSDHGDPPWPGGALSYDQLLELIRRADLVITW
jgi:hypothetical protein